MFYEPFSIAMIAQSENKCYYYYTCKPTLNKTSCILYRTIGER